MADFRDFYKTQVLPQRSDPQPTRLARASPQPVAAAASLPAAPGIGTGKALLDGLRRKLSPQAGPGASVTTGIRG